MNVALIADAADQVDDDRRCDDQDPDRKERIREGLRVAYAAKLERSLCSFASPLTARLSVDERRE
jgi:hypothetical protein